MSSCPAPVAFPPDAVVSRTCYLSLANRRISCACVKRTRPLWGCFFFFFFQLPFPNRVENIFDQSTFLRFLNVDDLYRPPPQFLLLRPPHYCPPPRGFLYASPMHQRSALIYRSTSCVWSPTMPDDKLPLQRTFTYPFLPFE